ncbi:MAG: GGDEF domain-containing protein [Lawsonibacter sp.]
MPEIYLRDVFEYNGVNQSIFFHSHRDLILGDETRQDNFPKCWIDSELVHPHFASAFEKAFSQIQSQPNFVLPEILLKSKAGIYTWFKLILWHMDDGHQDSDTVIAILEPTEPERVKELEAMRMRRFYQVLLSEAIAHAEVDLESGQLKSAGGLWSCYQRSCDQNAPSFLQEFSQQLEKCLSSEDFALFQHYCNPAIWDPLPLQQELSHRFHYQRLIGGQMRWVELVLHIFRESITQNVYALIYLKDIHAEKERSLAQAMAAERDPLTGIYNRAAFERIVSQHVQQASSDFCGFLMLLDLDNFKQINDQNGHLKGDHALMEVAQALRTSFREHDLIGRLGGDEFLIYVRAPIDKKALLQRLKEILQILHQKTALPLTCSIGVTRIFRPSFQYDKSLEEADIALYQSKKRGKNRFVFFEDVSPL